MADAYKAGTAGLKSLRQDAGDVERLIDEYDQEVELTNELQEALEATTTPFDEDELQLELEKLTLSTTEEERVTRPALNAEKTRTTLLAEASSKQYSSDEKSVVASDVGPVALPS